MTMIFFGIFLRLNQATTAWRIPAALRKFGASYSYSLYLVHNTVLVIVFENIHSWPKPVAIAFGVVLAHLVALLKSSVPAPQPQTASPVAPVAAEAKAVTSVDTSALERA